jgi:hypothetical protein
MDKLEEIRLTTFWQAVQRLAREFHLDNFQYIYGLISLAGTTIEQLDEKDQVRAATVIRQVFQEQLPKFYEKLEGKKESYVR